MIVKKMTNPIPDPPQRVEVMEQLQNYSGDVEDPEGNILGWHFDGEILC